MTVERIRRCGDRDVGVVVAAETGVFTVLTDLGRIRVGLDGCMLADVARDRSCLPVVGDWVSLRRWSDGRWTLTGPMAERLAPVVPLRRPRRAPGRASG